MWTSGPWSGPDTTTLCGWNSARALVNNAQAVWELVLLIGTSDKYMLKSIVSRNGTECLLARSGDDRPYRGLYTGAGAVGGSVYCGFPSAASLLRGGAVASAGSGNATSGARDVVSAVWTIVPLP